MSGWLDPPHERVRLTVKELQALETLERALTQAGAGTEPTRNAWVRATARATAAFCRVWAWCLLPLGLAVIGLGLVRSLAFGIVGTLMVGAGLGVVISRSALRIRRPRASITRPGR